MRFRAPLETTAVGPQSSVAAYGRRATTLYSLRLGLQPNSPVSSSGRGLVRNRPGPEADLHRYPQSPEIIPMEISDTAEAPIVR